MARRNLSHSWWRWCFMHCPMTWPVANVEGGKQRRCPVAFVVMGHGPGPSFLHRQAGLGAIECLNLALLVDREHQGLVRRIEIETNDVFDLLDETFVIGQLEGLDQMRLEAVRVPNP